MTTSKLVVFYFLSLTTMAVAMNVEHLPIFGDRSSEARLLMKMDEIIDTSSEIKASSELGSAIMSSARLLDGRSSSVDLSFLADYSIKFQGCHHITTWNNNAAYESDLRVATKRLVRFRLCPSGSCQARSDGCSSKYGDYVVDMSTFVQTFLQARAYARSYQCSLHAATCEDSCSASDDQTSCQLSCYAGYGLNYCVQSSTTEESSFDPLNYATCSAYSFWNQTYSSYYSYYVGPYCANQGGSIYLGLFTDNTCTAFVSDGKSAFAKKAGFDLPFSQESLISYDCFSCKEPASTGNADDTYYTNANDQADSDNVKEFCETVYAKAGRCESKMSISYPNEAACTYIKGIKLINNAGVMRTHSVRKSKAASVTIGLFTTLAVMLGAYVFYLRNSKYQLHFLSSHVT